ncbi:exopolyphosphatase-like protein [Delitschia confertaspora ATCC 74209]|uniref:Exopolyphosphatase-like protein n=1 Tax=Delitschia confertaspora ATCC 74209 TaxID=1513339 RepID=A0A9P4JJZ3_9PLEO|nr:exopolyphosphatase-like protein [Delitschia confertaspora ATCC 74209]
MTMALPRNSLRGFLVQAKAAIRTAIDKRQRIAFVIGNESADLDSLTCSILYAYVQSMAPPRNDFTPLYIPVTNIPRSGLQLRPEFLALFPHANIESQHIITLDDLPDMSVIQSKLPPENTKWILVDHNALQGQLGKIYSDRVAGVIDHHEDENKVRKDTGSEPHVIMKAGSCTSLVIENCQASWDLLSTSAMSSGAAHAQGDSLSDDSAVVSLWDAQVAQLGLASILIDTANLQSKDKTTEHDIRAVEYLEAKIMTCPRLSAQYTRDNFFKEIDSAKRDIGGLKLQDILRKDYKEWEQGKLRLGISSVVKPIAFLQEKAGKEAGSQSLNKAFLRALQKFAEVRNLDVYAVMTTSTSTEGQFQRELLVWAFNHQAKSAAVKFASNAKQELGLEDWHDSNAEVHEDDEDNHWRKLWWQRNVEHSRKRVAPMLREAMGKE